MVLILTDEGGVTATPDNTASLDDVTLSGEVKAGEFGPGKVGGTLVALPSGVYGIE